MNEAKPNEAIKNESKPESTQETKFTVTITVKDFIIPKNNTDPFYIVVSLVDEKNDYGEVKVEKLNPLSYFYGVEFVEAYQVKSVDKCKEIHTKLCEKYRKRRDEIDGIKIENKKEDKK